MDKNLIYCFRKIFQKISGTKFFLAIFIFSFAFYGNIFSVEPNQDSTIRFALWVQQDAFPGIEKEGEKTFDRPVAQLKELAPYFLSGMIYGYEFDYTPSDKARNVKEFFEFKPLHEFTESEKKSITYEKPWANDNKIWCWIKYERPEEYKKYFKAWTSIRTPRIIGRGLGKMTEGFGGIETGFGEAMKNAIREYERKMVKNKPKAITGKLLLNQPPLLGVDSGRYVVTLDFFLQCDKIVEYTNY